MKPNDLIEKKEKGCELKMSLGSPTCEKDCLCDDCELELEALKQMNKIWEDKLKDEGIMFHEGKICFDEKASVKFAKWLDKLLDKREKYTNKLWLDKIDKKIKYWKKEEQKWNDKKLEAFEKKDKYEGMYLGKANEVREIIRILKELKSKDKK